MNTSFGLRAARRVCAGVFLFAFAGCSADSGTTPGDGGSGAAVSAVKLTPSSSELGLGGTLQLRLTALDAQENEVAGRGTVWASGDTTKASVSQEGLVTARGMGVVQLQAVVDGKSAFSVINVVAARVASILVTPGSPRVEAGGTVQLAAAATDAGGAPLTDRLVFWQSSNNAVARVTSTGLVSGVTAGTAAISATSEGKSASVAVTVTGTTSPPPSGGGNNNPPPVDSVKVVPGDTTMVRNTTARFRARVFAGNQLVTGRTVTWSTSDGEILTVNASGDVTAQNRPNSQASVNATVEGKAGSATVKVTNKPANNVAVGAERPALQVGESTSLTATVRDSDDQAVPDEPVVWESSHASTARVTSEGNATARVTAIAAGSVTVTARTAEGVSGSTKIDVTAPPVPTPTTTRVNVSPAAQSIASGGTVQLTATPLDASGNARTGRGIGWVSTNNAVATVSNSGLVTGVGAGTATVTATADGVTGSAAITVTAPPPPPGVTASVEVTPATRALLVGQTQQLTATARDGNGAPREGRTFTWSSSAPGIATASQSGLVTAVSAGSATITATADGRTGSAAITVSAPPPASVARVEVAPGSKALTVGQTEQLSATTRDAGGTVLTGRVVTWRSSAAAVATVNASGLVTAVGAGSATITATSENASGTAAITVTAPAPANVARVAVSPKTWRMKENDSKQFTAATYDADGRVLTGRSCSWTYNKGAGSPVISIESATGLVRARREGVALITATCEGHSDGAVITVEK